MLGKEFFTENLTSHQKLEYVLKLQKYIDDTFRLIVFIYSLALALLAFGKGKPLLVILSSLLIVVALIYGNYVLFTIGPLLKRLERYGRIHLVFYHIEVILLICIFWAVMYYYIAPFRRAPKTDVEP